jgi:hypothetical protein
MTKYTTVEISGIVTQIAKVTDIKGYTEGILECFLPEENELTDEQTDKWVKDNNKRMRAICHFLNKNNL